MDAPDVPFQMLATYETFTALINGASIHPLGICIGSTDSSLTASPNSITAPNHKRRTIVIILVLVVLELMLEYSGHLASTRPLREVRDGHGDRRGGASVRGASGDSTIRRPVGCSIRMMTDIPLGICLGTRAGIIIRGRRTTRVVVFHIVIAALRVAFIATDAAASLFATARADEGG